MAQDISICVEVHYDEKENGVKKLPLVLQGSIARAQLGPRAIKAIHLHYLRMPFVRHHLSISWLALECHLEDIWNLFRCHPVVL